MNLKKFFAVLSMCIFTAEMFTGCGDDKKSDDDKYFIKTGMLKYMNVGEQQYSAILQKIVETLSLNVTPHKIIFFDNLNSMQMAFNAGQIDEISTYDCVADYIVARKANISILKNHTSKFDDDFCLAMREGDKDLYNQVNGILKQMKADGTLAGFQKKYIDDLSPGEEPAAVELEKFEGADTIKVAITGDLPPLDLVLADGTPTGFNTAVLSEIGKRLQKNIEIVQIESAARAAALESNRVDISFWAVVPINNIIPANIDKPEGIILSTPYYTGEVVHIGWGDGNSNYSTGLGDVVQGVSQ